MVCVWNVAIMTNAPNTMFAYLGIAKVCLYLSLKVVKWQSNFTKHIWTRDEVYDMNVDNFQLTKRQLVDIVPQAMEVIQVSWVPNRLALLILIAKVYLTFTVMILVLNFAAKRPFFLVITLHVFTVKVNTLWNRMIIIFLSVFLLTNNMQSKFHTFSNYL